MVASCPAQNLEKVVDPIKYDEIIVFVGTTSFKYCIYTAYIYIVYIYIRYVYIYIYNIRYIIYLCIFYNLCSCNVDVHNCFNLFFSVKTKSIYI